MTIIQEFKEENENKVIKEDFIDIEQFDYNKSYNNSVIIISTLSIFALIILIVVLYSLVRINEKTNKFPFIFWVIVVLLLLPTGITQIIALILAMIILSSNKEMFGIKK